MARAWRIVSSAYADVAFTGEGARRYGGRWNSPGVAMVYTAGSLSLAALEQLVHLGRSDLFTRQFVYVEVRFPDDAVLALDEAALPARWAGDLETTRFVGDSWIEAADSLVLRVPSVVVPGEHNYVVNPDHPDVPELHIEPAEPFAFDPRLAGPP